MEEQWYADHCLLRDLLRAHPDWTQQQARMRQIWDDCRCRWLSRTA